MKDQESNTYFITQVDSKPHVRSTSLIEVTDRLELLNNLLKEFEQSSESQKSEYRELLKEWILNIKETDLHEVDEQKVRDFIYEMF
jgi:hypothetical protein